MLFLLLGAVVAIVIVYLVIKLCYVKVYDLDGKALPGPTFAWDKINFSQLKDARRARKVSQFVHEELMNKIGDGNVVSSKLLLNTLVFLAHPDDVKTILSSHHSKFPKSSRYQRLDFFLGKKGMLILSGDQWQAQRQLVNPGFHAETLKFLVTLFNQHTDAYVNNLQKLLQANHGSVKLDMQLEFTRLTNDIICHSAFGFKMDDYKDVDLNEIITLLEEETVIRLGDYTDWWHKLFPERVRKSEYAAAKMRNLLEKVIQSRMTERANNNSGNNYGSKDLLDILVDSIDSDRNKLTAEEVRDNAITFFFAGYDTTSSLLSWIMYELALHPGIQAKCQEEADTVLSKLADGMISSDVISSLVYTGQVIKETLRLHPPAALLARKNSEETTVGGYRLPAETVFGVLVYSVHRHPDFWENPDIFDPDRFSPENSKKTLKHPFQFVPFSAGGRNCIGQRFAQMEATVILAKIMKCFTFQLSAEDVKDIRFEEMIVQRPRNLKVQITARKM